MDDEEYGKRRKEGVAMEGANEGRLEAEEVVFVTRNEEQRGIGGEEGEEWSEEKWEVRALHVKRMELIKRATAPRKLTEPRPIKLLDVLANALTRNKAQLFPTNVGVQRISGHRGSVSAKCMSDVSYVFFVVSSHRVVRLLSQQLSLHTSSFLLAPLSHLNRL